MMDGPPRYGSLLEAMCLVVQRHKQMAEVLSVRAQVQASVDKKEAVGAFKQLIQHHRRVDFEAETNKMRNHLKSLEKIKEVRMVPMINTARERSIPRKNTAEVRARIERANRS